MDAKKIQIARKYAIAFLNIYINKINEKDFLNLVTAFKFLKTHPDVLFFFFLPNLTLSVKNEIINTLFTKFDLNLEFKQLTDFLIENSRAFLFVDILREIILIYQERNSIILFDITSANELKDSDLKDIKYFLERKSGCKVIESYEIDKNLIAGIKAKSTTLLWEYSIAKQMRNIRRLILAG